MDRNMRLLLTHLLICACVYTCNLFEFKCPYTSEWKFRAFAHCNTSSLTQCQCLFDELGQYRQTRYTFIESCHYKPDYVQPGYKYVVSGGRRKKECSLDKYQPLLFWSNVTHECLFSKSKCSDIGQITYNNGTTETDRQCRCDYKKGYDFITKPVNKCFCVPSKEDCSCYKKACSGTQRLSPDYTCTELKDAFSQSMCPPLLYTWITKDTESMNILQKKTLSSQQLSQNKRSTEHLVLTIITIIVVLVASILVVTECLPWIFFIRLNPALNITAKLNEDCSIKLSWSFPKTEYERSKYIIEYTYDDWKTTITFERKEKQSSCIMTNIVPYKTYRIRVIYFCTYHGNLIESLASNEALIETNSPKLNVYAKKDFDAKCLKLSWSEPVNTNIEIKQYTVLYTCGDWKAPREFNVPASKLSGEIKPILPLKTYKCKVMYTCTCCPTGKITETCESELSNEVSVDTDRPGRPENPTTEGSERSMTLRWSPPAETLFETKKYKIEYTINDDWFKPTCQFILADGPLEYSIDKLLELTVYRFRIYSCMDDDTASISNSAIFSNKFACKISVPIESEQYTAHFDNPESQAYKTTTEDLILGVDKAYKSMNGIQKSYIEKYRNGSLIASLVLTSQDFYDDMALRNVIEEYVKKGALGRFATKHEGFMFQALNMPFPPKMDKLSVQDKCITLKWSLQQESFFKIKQFKVEVTTDEWKSSKCFPHLGTEFNYGIPNLSSTTTFRFRVVTCTHNSIESRPSNEMQTTIIVPVINMKVTLVYKSTEGFMLTWDHRKCSTPSAIIIDNFKILVNGKYVDSTREKSYTYLPQHSGDTIYTFAVIACATNGLESEIGEEVTCDTDKEPLPPRNVTATSISRGIKMSWENPTYPKRVKTFTIKIMNDEETFVTVDGSEKSCTLNDLQPLTKYFISMRTCSVGNFEGWLSATVECDTKEPLPPTQLKMVECHNGVKLTWLETQFPVGRHFKNYIVYTTFENKETYKKTKLPFCLFRRLNSSCKYEFSCSTFTSNDIESKRSESFPYVSPFVLPRRETS